MFLLRGQIDDKFGISDDQLNAAAAAGVTVWGLLRVCHNKDVGDEIGAVTMAMVQRNGDVACHIQAMLPFCLEANHVGGAPIMAHQLCLPLWANKR